MMTSIQTQALELFQSGQLQELVTFFRDFPATFPQKQFPVVRFANYGTPGEFGYRTSNTTFAIPNEDDSFMTFTIGILGDLTLNLHALTVDSVDWVNGTQAMQWVYKSEVSRLEADELVQWAEASLIAS